MLRYLEEGDNEEGDEEESKDEVARIDP